MDVTVQTITDSAIDLADMKYSQFVDQSGTAGTELIRYANLAYRDLYSQIILSKEFYFTTTDTVNVVGGTDSYALPTDFYKLDGVDLSLGGDRSLTLRPLQFAERNKFKSGVALTTAPFGYVFRYVLVGSNIKFVPMPSGTHTVTLWYTPEPANITTLATTLSLPPGGDEYMSLYIACAMLAKEESDNSALNAKRLEVLDQMRNSLKDRDQGGPHYVVDESTLNSGAFYPYRGFD